LANISYRVGRKLTLEAGPKFAGDSEANKMITGDPALLSVESRELD